MVLPDEHHTSRYCKPTTLVAGEVQPTAFMATEGDPCPSVNWLEHFGHVSHEVAVSMVRECFIARGFRLRPKGAFAVISVGGSLKALSDRLIRGVTFQHAPVVAPPDPSHSEIQGIEIAAANAAALILSLQVIETFAALP